MKIISSIIFSFLLLSCAAGKERIFIGSTPAGHVVRAFLGIPFSDSVDFIRWKIAIQDNKYTLRCNYGIGKPNTNGFFDGGKWVTFDGSVRKEKNYYYLGSGDKTLRVVELNIDLLHILDPENNLLIGNGGWSYTLNNIAPLGTDRLNLSAKQTILKDSMVFQGRTPCGVPGIIPSGKLCYKLKWYFVLYAEKNKPAMYKVLGTPWRQEGGRVGAWKIIKTSDGRITYELNDEHGHALMDLVKLDENILLFADRQGKLLVGDEDFSYTLNKKR